MKTNKQRINKQTQTLISWAKKYADCDALLNTTIEGNNITINTMMSENGEFMRMNVSKNNNLVRIYEFDFNDNKWSEVKL